jgi:hypothetical protein
MLRKFALGVTPKCSWNCTNSDPQAAHATKQMNQSRPLAKLDSKCSKNSKNLKTSQPFLLVFLNFVKRLQKISRQNKLSTRISPPTSQIMIERGSLSKYKWKSRKSKSKRKIMQKKFDFEHSIQLDFFFHVESFPFAMKIH